MIFFIFNIETVLRGVAGGVVMEIKVEYDIRQVVQLTS